MKKLVSSVVIFLATITSVYAAEGESLALNGSNSIVISVIGQGVAPEHTISNYQSPALAKKAAIAGAELVASRPVSGQREQRPQRGYLRRSEQQQREQCERGCPRP